MDNPGIKKMQKLGKQLAEVAGQMCTPARVSPIVEAKTRGTGAMTKSLMHKKSDLD